MRQGQLQKNLGGKSFPNNCPTKLWNYLLNQKLVFPKLIKQLDASNRATHSKPSDAGVFNLLLLGTLRAYGFLERTSCLADKIV